MFRSLLFIISLLLMSTVRGQNKTSIELDIIGRYDKHADYISRFGSRSYTDPTRLWGKSFGFHLNYVRPLDQHLYLKAGLGYYNLGIDKVRQSTPFAGVIAKARNINYTHPSGIQPLFSTNKYHYDNLSLTLGLAYQRPFLRKSDLIIGGDFYYLYSFSQLYHINYDHIKYRTNIGRTLGFGVNTYFGLLQKFNNTSYYLSPKLIIPVYQQLKGDQMFGEDESVKMEKWLNGIGVSFTIGKYL